MSPRRPADFDLAAALRDPSFTPGHRDRDGLLNLVATGDDRTALTAERAAARLGAIAADAAVGRMAEALPVARARYVRLVGRVAASEAQHPGLWDALVRATEDPDPRTRRYAVVALGRAGDHPGVEDTLLHLWPVADRPELRRALAASLGRVGGARARELLLGIHAEDGELTRIVRQALLTLDRTAHRPDPSTVNPLGVSSVPLTVELWCRPGLEGFCVEALDPSWRPEVTGEGLVRGTLHGPLQDVFGCRAMTWFGFPLSDERVRGGEGAAEAIARALTGDTARRVFQTYTTGTVRYRIGWSDGGHHRADVWRAAALVAAETAWVNDPHDATWEVRVGVANNVVKTTLSPRSLDDPRFAYRIAAVPAASHPALAAALALAGGVRQSDVVWDPFVGSGLELVERAKLGPWQRLVGTDTSPEAVESARANLQSAGIDGAEIHLRDALEGAPEGVSLVVTNPPMGYRAGFGEDVGMLLERLVTAVAGWLKPGGRMVWIAPQGDRFAATARRHGLRVVLDQGVELGTFPARMQRYDKPFRRMVTRP